MAVTTVSTPTPERWQRIEEVFEQALALEAAARAGFLDQVCGDDAELREEVASLIASVDGAEGALRGVVDVLEHLCAEDDVE